MMNKETAIMLLEHTSYDDFNLLEHQIKGRLEAIKVLIKENKNLQQRINDAMDYINFLVIFNENINGKFNETIWGEELLEILGGKE